VVRQDADQVEELLEVYNQALAAEGWELIPERTVGGRPIFTARPTGDDRRALADAARSIATTVDSDYISRQIRWMEASVDSDPDLAIGTAKEFVETICKAILADRGIELAGSEDVPRLVRLVAEELRLVPEGVHDELRAAERVRRLLGNLAQIVQNLAEIRNTFGTGHGHEPTRTGLRPRHAQLAVGSAITLAVFLFDTSRER
jgi:hypothetical protein